MIRGYNTKKIKKQIPPLLEYEDLIIRLNKTLIDGVELNTRFLPVFPKVFYKINSEWDFVRKGFLNNIFFDLKNKELVAFPRGEIKNCIKVFSEGDGTREVLYEDRNCTILRETKQGKIKYVLNSKKKAGEDILLATVLDLAIQGACLSRKENINSEELIGFGYSVANILSLWFDRLYEFSITAFYKSEILEESPLIPLGGVVSIPIFVEGAKLNFYPSGIDVLGGVYFPVVEQVQGHRKDGSLIPPISRRMLKISRINRGWKYELFEMNEEYDKEVFEITPPDLDIIFNFRQKEEVEDKKIKVDGLLNLVKSFYEDLVQKLTIDRDYYGVNVERPWHFFIEMFKLSMGLLDILDNSRVSIEEKRVENHPFSGVIRPMVKWGVSEYLLIPNVILGICQDKERNLPIFRSINPVWGIPSVEKQENGWKSRNYLPINELADLAPLLDFEMIVELMSPISLDIISFTVSKKWKPKVGKNIEFGYQGVPIFRREGEARSFFELGKAPSYVNCKYFSIEKKYSIDKNSLIENHIGFVEEGTNIKVELLPIVGVDIYFKLFVYRLMFEYYLTKVINAYTQRTDLVISQSLNYYWKFFSSRGFGKLPRSFKVVGWYPSGSVGLRKIEGKVESQIPTEDFFRMVTTFNMV